MIRGWKTVTPGDAGGEMGGQACEAGSWMMVVW